MRKGIAASFHAEMVIGRLTLKESFYRGCGRGQKLYWRCVCACQTKCEVDIYSLRNGVTQSCGCLARERASEANIKHGATKNYCTTRLYNIWQKMRDRCANSKNEWFHNYGGRGIRVCEEWAGSESYPVFAAWATANGYVPTLTLERKETDGNYEPNNCCWIPKGKQSSNTRRNVLIKAWGQVKLLKEWEKDSRCQVRYVTIRERLKRGWTPEAAISTIDSRPKRAA